MNVPQRRLLAILEARGDLSARELAAALGLPRTHLRSLHRALHDLVRDGSVARVGRGRYGLLTEGREIEGRLVRDPRGHGRVGSIHVRAAEIRGLGDGDRLRLRIERGEGAAVGRVIEVLRRSRPQRVGTVRRGPGTAWVVPFRDRRHWEIRLSAADAMEVLDGEVVVVDPPKDEWGYGRVVSRLGMPGSRDTDVRAVAAANELPVEFPDEALLEAEERAALGVSAEEASSRADLRGEWLVTIDGENARDFDDAVTVTPLPGGRFRLVVAIADVSWYVRPGSALDREAAVRGNSVYFPDRAIPMLPEPLSNDVCSLRPGEDRLAVAVEIVFDREGRSETVQFLRAVMRSAARLTYTEVTGLLSGSPPAWLVPMAELAQILIRRRQREGSIDFDLAEPEVLLDADGGVVALRSRERTLAHRMIEEFMLAANRAVAERLADGEGVVLYRIHEPPSAAGLQALEEMLRALGLPVGELDGPRIGAALRRLGSRPERHALHFLMLRAMKQARYAVRNPGHFALNFEHYVHFTSPIRRYADLVIHRLLKALLWQEAPVQVDLGPIAERTSERERAAADAERDMLDIYRAEFMQRHLGEIIEGIISGVGRPGLFVTLEPFPVEGLLPIHRLPDRYEPDARGLALVGVRSGERFALGDRLRVRVDAVDPYRCSVLLGLPNREGGRSAPPPSRGG